MKKTHLQPAPQEIDTLIVEVRSQKAILDVDLAWLYGVPTKSLNRAVKRNSGRFPPDFVFQLLAEEAASLRCHFGTSKGSRGGRRYLPYAFTEHGAVMAANVLNSERAVQMSVFVVRAFVKMRSAFADSREPARKLALLEQELKIRLNVHEAAIVDVLQRIMRILDLPPPPPQPPPPEIGFHVREDAVPYRTNAKHKRRPAP